MKQRSLLVMTVFLLLSAKAYLNKKHKDMIPKISSALKAMKDDGTYQKIVNRALGK